MLTIEVVPIVQKNCLVKGCFNNYYAKGYCEKHYANFRRHGFPIKQFYARKIEFKVNDDGCFVCTSHKLNKDGYPTYTVHKKKWLMNRFIYTEMFGEIPKGLIIRHKCDNPSCINPEHLETGTIADNNRDSVERGRNAKGSKHPNSILNEDLVKEIKLLILDGKSNKELSERYKIDHRIISNIRHERRWKHVEVK